MTQRNNIHNSVQAFEKTNQIGVFFDVLGTKQITEATNQNQSRMQAETKQLFISTEEALLEADPLHKHRRDQQEKDIESLDFQYWRFSDNIFFLSSLPKKAATAEYEGSFESTFDLFLTSVSLFFCHMLAKCHLTRGGMSMGYAVLNNEAVLGSALTESYKIESSGNIEGGGLGVSENIFTELKDWASTTIAYGMNNSTGALQTFDHWFIEYADEPNFSLLNIFHHEILSALGDVKIDEILDAISRALAYPGNGSAKNQKIRAKWTWTAAHLYFSLVLNNARLRNASIGTAAHWKRKFTTLLSSTDMTQILKKSRKIGYRIP